MRKIILLSIVSLCFGCSSIEKSANCSLNPPQVTISFFHPDDLSFKKGLFKACQKVDDGMVEGASYESPTYKYASVLYEYQDTSDFCRIIKGLGDGVLATVKPSDTCYFILTSNDVLLRKYDSLELSAGFSKIEREMLVPYLGGIVPCGQVNPNASCGLNDDYTLLILRSGNGDVVKDAVKKEFAYLPSELRHGYRSGIAYNAVTLTIIYWSMAW